MDYRTDNSPQFAKAFLDLAQRIWPRNYDAARSAAALDKTINIGAWDGDRLVGSVRLLSDGYFFCTVPEVMVDPEYRRKGIGKELLRRALDGRSDLYSLAATMFAMLTGRGMYNAASPIE